MIKKALIFGVNKVTDDLCAVWIIYQKFRGVDFYNGNPIFQATNGVILHSAKSPAMFTNDYYYVRGYDKDGDNYGFIIKEKYLPSLIEAVSEYNNTVKNEDNSYIIF